MRVTLLTHYYPPEAGAPQTRLGALAAGLSRAGVELTVHTCPPHYPDGVVAAGHRNGLRSRESEEDGVRVVRGAVLPAANAGVAMRLLDHASFAASALAGAGRAGPADVAVVESPPLFLAAIAPAYARRVGARLALHVSDLWPDSVVELGAVTDRRAISAARALERHAYRHAARLVAPTAGIAARLDDRPEARGRVVRIPPAVDLERFAGIAPVNRDGPLRVLYAGTVGLAQGLETLVDAARRAGPRVAITIAGDGAELGAVSEAAAGLSNVTVLGRVAADVIPRLYDDADVAAVLLRDRPLFEGALPTKTFEAMAAGRPVVMAASGEVADLVRDARAGVVVPPEDPAAFAGALVDLAARSEDDLRRIGADARACADGFRREAMIGRWVALLDELAKAPT